MNARNSLRIRHEPSLADGLVRVSDAGCIGLGFWAASLYPNTIVDPSYLLAAAVAIIILFLIGEFVGLYQSWRGVSTYREIAAALLAWGYSVAALMAIGLLTGVPFCASRIGLGLGTCNSPSGPPMRTGGNSNSPRGPLRCQP